MKGVFCISKINITTNDLYVGTNEKQVQVVKKILESGRRSFGSSGASLTHQIHNPIYKEKGIDPNLAKIGMNGEHKTTKVLKEWMKDKPNVILVDSVHIKGHGNEELNEETGTLDGGDTDHILLIGDYIILIDSKNWKSKKNYGINKEGQVIRSKKTFPGGHVNSRGALFLWRKYLQDYKLKFSSIINITADKVFVTRDIYWWKQPFKLVTIEDLTEFLDKIWNAIPYESKEYINANLVSSVVSNAIQPYDYIKETMGNVASLLK